MTTRTQGFLLLLFGAALLRLGTSDLLLRFVKPNARLWVVLAACFVIVLAVWTLIASARHRADHDSNEHDSPDHDSSDHDSSKHDSSRSGVEVDAHGHSTASRAAWLIVLPVIAVLVIGPPALGSFTANRQAAGVILPATQSFPALPAGDPVRVSVFDFAERAVTGGGASLAGRTVALTGFVARTTTDGFVLARLVITCCAADATPILLYVRTGTSGLHPDQWVTVTGTYAGQDPTNENVPLVTASRIARVHQPANPYD